MHCNGLQLLASGVAGTGGFGPVGWSIVVGYLVFSTWLGARVAGKQSTMRDFFLGGRKLPWYAVSGSIIATEISAMTFVVVPFIVFTKGGRTDNVFFYDVKADGFSLDDKRQVVKDNDLPDAMKAWKARDPKKLTDRTQKAFFVSADEIREKKFDLSINRYKEEIYEEETFDHPSDVLGRMKSLEAEISSCIEELEAML